MEATKKPGSRPGRLGTLPMSPPKFFTQDGLVSSPVLFLLCIIYAGLHLIRPNSVFLIVRTVELIMTFSVPPFVIVLLIPVMNGKKYLTSVFKVKAHVVTQIDASAYNFVLGSSPGLTLNKGMHSGHI